MAGAYVSFFLGEKEQVKPEWKAGAGGGYQWLHLEMPGLNQVTIHGMDADRIMALSDALRNEALKAGFVHADPEPEEPVSPDDRYTITDNPPAV